MRVRSGVGLRSSYVVGRRDARPSRARSRFARPVASNQQTHVCPVVSRLALGSGVPGIPGLIKAATENGETRDENRSNEVFPMTLSIYRIRMKHTHSKHTCDSVGSGRAVRGTEIGTDTPRHSIAATHGTRPRSSLHTIRIHRDARAWGLDRGA
jgi:hypothetical protein